MIIVYTKGGNFSGPRHPALLTIACRWYNPLADVKKTAEMKVCSSKTGMPPGLSGMVQIRDLFCDSDHKSYVTNITTGVQG